MNRCEEDVISRNKGSGEGKREIKSGNERKRGKQCIQRNKKEGQGQGRGKISGKADIPIGGQLGKKSKAESKWRGREGHGKVRGK